MMFVYNLEVQLKEYSIQDCTIESWTNLKNVGIYILSVVKETSSIIKVNLKTSSLDKFIKKIWQKNRTALCAMYERSQGRKWNSLSPNLYGSFPLNYD